MVDILKNASKSVLGEAIDRNLMEQNRFWGSSPYSDFHDRTHVIWFITGYPVSVLNAVSGARIPHAAVDAIIEDVLEYFIPHQIPVTWWVGPLTRPRNLGESLEEHGFKRALEMPGMVKNLSILEPVGELPHDFSIIQVSEESHLRKWADAQSKGFGGGQDEADIFFKFERSLGMNPHSRWIRFVGMVEGEPVAVSVLFLGAGVAALFNVAVVPEFRRKGFGTLITQEPLRRARSMGYHYGVLKATPLGTELYKSMKFEECSKIHMYVYKL
jgi:ribosomal protein S18 acetylase RimI-like enzyme